MSNDSGVSRIVSRSLSPNDVHAARGLRCAAPAARSAIRLRDSVERAIGPFHRSSGTTPATYQAFTVRALPLEMLR